MPMNRLLPGMVVDRRGLTVVASAFLTLIGCSAPETTVEIPRYDAETFYDTVSVSGGSFSHDEARVLFTTDATGIFNAYVQDLGTGERTQLTTSDSDATYAISYFPADDRVLFRADQGGNELNHVYVREVDGTVVDLTPGERHVARFDGWSHDRTAFYVQTNERDPRHFDLYRFTVDGYQRTLLYQNDDGYFITDVSNDEQLVALNKPNSNTDSDVFIHSRTDGSTRQVSPDAEDVDASGGLFTPDGRALVYRSNADGEFYRTWSYDLGSGERTVLASADWDVSSITFSWKGKYRATSINADGRTRLSVTDVETGDPVELPEFGSGDILGVTFSPSESKVLLRVNGDRAPTNLFLVDLEQGGEAVQLTNSMNPAIEGDHLVDAEVVRYPSYDGLEIPGLLYRPKTASADNPVPAMLMMHGGPGGQSRHGYNAMVQHLVNHGYAIFRVNNRGSSGYGKTFFHMDDRKHGEADLDDCVSAKEYLATLDWIDGAKIGIMGGSYGGYLVAAGLAFRPEVFDVGIDIFGVTNWVRTLQSMPAWWGPQREALFEELGNPETDLERLRRISPVFHADKITKPLLVVQGANDPRVLQVESDEIVEAVRANGVPVEYVVFDDEGHGFRNRSNRITAQNAYLEFLDRYLKGAEAAPSAPGA